MKRIALLTCLKATGVCSGAACFNAINRRTKSFERYSSEEVEIIAFFHCNGCQCDYDKDEEYLEKITRVCSLKPDAVHIGKCTIINGSECNIITEIIDTMEGQGLNVIRGTH